jgi:Sulfotransferase family
MNTELDRYHRPERNLIVSGISRSGTSLLSVLLNSVDNVVCFNEVLPPDPERLPEALARARRDLLAGKPVRNKFDDVGELTTDTLSTMVKMKSVVKKRLDEDLCVATKRNIPYLNEAEALLALGYPMVVMIRDPVYTLGSWGSPKAAAAGIPGARVGVGDVHGHWHRVRFSRQDVVQRRAEAWQHYAARVWSLRERVRIVDYEGLCARPLQTVVDLCRWADLPPPGVLPEIVRPSCNLDDRYPNLPHIRAAVRELCPARAHFGYC